jgi:hypothetical protein
VNAEDACRAVIALKNTTLHDITFDCNISHKSEHMIRSMLEPVPPPAPVPSPYGQASSHHQPATSSRLPAYNGAYNVETPSNGDYFSPTSFSAGNRQPPATNYYHQQQHQHQHQQQPMNGYSDGYMNGYHNYSQVQPQQHSYYHGGFQPHDPSTESRQSRYLPSVNASNDYSSSMSTSTAFGLGSEPFTPVSSQEQINALDSGFLSPSGTSGLGGDTRRSSTHSSNSETTSFGNELAHFDQIANQSSQYDSQFSGFSGLSVNIPESSAAVIVANDVVLATFLSSSVLTNGNIAKEDSSFEEGTTGKEFRDDSSEERLSCHSAGLCHEESQCLPAALGEKQDSHFPSSLTSLSSSSFDINNHLDESLLYSFSSLSIPQEIPTSANNNNNSINNNINL